MAFARPYLNIGFAVGTGLGAAALAFDSTSALVAMVLLNAVVLLVNAVIVVRLPAAGTVRHERVKRPRLAVLRDKPYVAVSALIGVLMYHAILLTEIVPLWVITRTDAPKPVLGALLALAGRGAGHDDRAVAVGGPVVLPDRRPAGRVRRGSELIYLGQFIS